MIKWPDLVFPPINLWSAPRRETHVDEESPCVKQCRLKDDICLGCGRTISEIQNWENLETWEKIEIKNRLNEG